MKNKLNPADRHFAYRHPTFGTKSRPKASSAWNSTVYYCWWLYLKRNKNYMACCDAGGKGALASLYEDFGDVRGDDFKAWWSEDSRGVRLFAEPRVDETARVMQTGEQAADASEVVTLCLPLYLPKRFLLKRCRELLGNLHKGKRGKQQAKLSRANYRIKGQPNIPALKQALMVYDAIEEAEGIKPKKPYWKIAMDLKIVEKKMRIQPSDTAAESADKRNILTAIVGRYKKRVEEYIKATSHGAFI